MSDEVISDVLEQTKSDLGGGFSLGLDVQGEDGQSESRMGVQAPRDADNTFYGLNVAGAFFGTSAGAANTTGESNVFLGHSAGLSNTVGDSNIFIGRNSGYWNSMGTGNIFIGYFSGYSISWGMENTYLGHKAGESGSGAYGITFLGFGRQ